MTLLSRLVLAALLLSVATFARRASAQPWFDAGENELEDAYADGDLDAEDHLATHLRPRPAGADVHGESWVSLMGFARELQSGKNDVGAMLLVGLALDRIATGPVHRVTGAGVSDDGGGGGATEGAPGGGTSSLAMHLAQEAGRGSGQRSDGDASRPSAPHAESPLIPRRFARDCVAAAWRASGLGVDDRQLDALVSRSRASALLPETRFRAMRLWDDAAHTTTVATTDGTTLYDAIGANLVLELRLTWRLDRLLYAGDEPAIERVRLERLDARSRLATRTLEGLFAWARGRVDAAAAAPGSRDEAEARLRLAEAEATLDVLTGGWFATTAKADDASEADPP